MLMKTYFFIISISALFISPILLNCPTGIDREKLPIRVLYKQKMLSLASNKQHTAGIRESSKKYAKEQKS